MPCVRKTRLWVPVKDANDMKTTTQIMLEEGSRRVRALCTSEHKLVNFQSFNMDDPRYGLVGPVEQELVQPLKSGYMREFTQPYPNRCKPIEEKEFSPDFIFNRLPKNDFDPLTGTHYKFLDDHIRKVPEVRKKVNFFRQMRNQSFLLY